MRFEKRALDIFIAFFGLIILSPLLLVIGLFIRVVDGAPAIFRQKRIGRNGREFTIYKFRKFRKDIDPNSYTPAGESDPRYFPFGKILEKTKLNELPQLVNVLQGSMSIVGPRPEVPAFIHCYKGQFRRLLDFTPGIFGPSQTKFRQESALYPDEVDPVEYYESVLFPAKANIDIEYYRSATLQSDMYWVVKSILSVFLLTNRSERVSAGSLV